MKETSIAAYVKLTVRFIQQYKSTTEQYHLQIKINTLFLPVN